MSPIRKVGIIGNLQSDQIEKLLLKAGVEVVREKAGYSEKLAGASLIIEALTEDPAKKKDILSKCDEQASPDTILACLSSGGLTEVAASAKKRDRVVGLNFIFNPFEDKCLVQIVKGLETSAPTLEACRLLMEKGGAAAVIADDIPGLLIDRTMALVINEAAIMYTTKVATVEDMDRIVRLCLNWPMGPFEFADHMGIDKVVSTLEAAAVDESRYLPCRLLKQMAADGQLGKKTKKGFYTYS